MLSMAPSFPRPTPPQDILPLLSPVQPNTCSFQTDCFNTAIARRAIPFDSFDDSSGSEDDGDNIIPTFTPFPPPDSQSTYPSASSHLYPTTTSAPGPPVSLSTFTSSWTETSDWVTRSFTSVITSTFLVAVSTTTVTSSPTVPAASSDPTETSPHPGLSLVEIAAISAAFLMGALSLFVFFLFLRKGTFGSGVLFGLKYGAARDPNWPGHAHNIRAAAAMRAMSGGNTGMVAKHPGESLPPNTVLLSTSRPSILRHHRTPH